MHGRPRQSLAAADPARQRDEETKAAKLRSLLAEVLRNHRERSYSTRALQQNARLLELNPEVYTAWNYRKLAVKHLLESEPDHAARKLILDEELEVVERAFKRNFKSYGAWHHRKWVIAFGLSSLDREFHLLDKLLAADARNFNGWNYRRYLASIKKVPGEMELQYTIKKINENFSNYSAWHNRSVLLSKQFMEDATEKERQQEILTEEYELVKQAFFTEPEDQSGWFYLIWLLSQTVTSSRPSLKESPGIISKHGAYGTARLSFSVEVQTTHSGVFSEKDGMYSLISWPVESTEQCVSCSEYSAGSLDNGITLATEKGLDATAEWQFKTLEDQINACRELLELEKDSKWAKLTLVKLLMAYDDLASSYSAQKQYSNEVKQVLKDLIALDCGHACYYDEQLSLLLIEQISSNLQTLSGHWWELKKSDDRCEGWLRLNCLSLSKLGHFEKLTWVQRLDLSHNKLQSLEGLEPLQLLIFLDLSHNLLSTATALGPIHFLKNLQALNIKHNQIGNHTIDTHRYSFPSALNNCPDNEAIKTSGQPITLHSWEVVAVFRGMGLRQLDILGNPIATDDLCKSQIIEALPCLVWLDGMKVSL